MASDLLSIAKSGSKAARIALDITAHNIANASTDGYIRRSAKTEEIAAPGPLGSINNVSLSGVRVGGIIRNADQFRLSEVRRTTADVSRADAELSGLEKIETAVEGSRIYDGIVDFESALQHLSADPVNPSLRAAAIEAARAAASNFNVADASLKAVGDGVRFEASEGVKNANTLMEEIARVNVKMTRAPEGSSDQVALLDRRDQLLKELSGEVGVFTSVDANNMVEVRIGSSTGPVLVSQGTSATMSMQQGADGTISFEVDGAAVTVGSGALAGHEQALDEVAAMQTELDDLAMSLADAVNTVQTNGSALDGTPGTAMFAGTGAGDLALAFENGALIATAPAGAEPNSRDPGNLGAMSAALETAGVAAGADKILFDISATVKGRSITRDTLATIADNATVSLQAQAGVDLDAEAVNLVRYQQAFQASGRVMQVASDLFDTIIGIR